MKKIGILTLIYGVIILIGGWIGHVKAGSQASLIMGLVFAILLILCAFLSFKGKQLGAFGALLLTLVLDGFFTYRFIVTKKWMPPGMMSLVSLLTLLLLALLIQRVNGSKRRPN